VRWWPVELDSIHPVEQFVSVENRMALANAGNLPLLGFGLWGVPTASIALDAVPAGRRASFLYADRGRPWSADARPGEHCF
jgi:hypothetical protein